MISLNFAKASQQEKQCLVMDEKIWLGKTTYIAFVDLYKAIDKVDWNKM